MEKKTPNLKFYKTDTGLNVYCLNNPNVCPTCGCQDVAAGQEIEIPDVKELKGYLRKLQENMMFRHHIMQEIFNEAKKKSYEIQEYILQQSTLRILEYRAILARQESEGASST